MTDLDIRTGGLDQPQPFAPLGPGMAHSTTFGHAPLEFSGDRPTLELPDLADATNGEVLLAGLLVQIHGALDRLVEAAVDDRLSFDLNSLWKLSWTANPGYADQELERLYRGVAVFNLDAVADLTVGFAAGAGKAGATNASFVISPRGYIVVPLLTSHVSVGGPGAAGAIVTGLDHAPVIAGGRF